MTDDKKIEQEEFAKPKGKKKFFSFGSISLVVSLVALILSVYFFCASIKKPELNIFAHPDKAIIVRSNQTSHLSVKYDDQSIDGDVIVVQITFWNAGKKAITSNDVLEPLVIRTAKGERKVGS